MRLALTGAQQAAIGFFCGSCRPTVGNAAHGRPVYTATNYGATRLVIPAPGTENDDHNPPRIAPRHVFDIGVGTDNLFHQERFRTTLRIRRHQFHEQGRALQFPVDLQRHALRAAARLPDRDRVCILGAANGGIHDSLP